jgi:predicted nucleic acid-binding Zn finger protein
VDRCAGDGRFLGGRESVAGIEPVLTGPIEAPGMTSVEQWQAALEAAGELAPEAAQAIVSLHGDRGMQAIKAVSEGRVKEYRDFTVVVGHREEYVVENGGCTCKDSEYNLDREDPAQQCWHALAVGIARRIDAVDFHDMWYSDVREFL